MDNQKALQQDLLGWLARAAAIASLPGNVVMRLRDLFTQEGVHGAVLSLRRFALPSAFFQAYYNLATKVFIHTCVKVNTRMTKPVIRSVYLRRGGGRGELVPGASDLDFFLVLEEMSAEQEMLFLKEFWNRFRYWKKYFPFLGETLMGDRNELANWFHTPTVRSFEASFSWKLLGGADELSGLGQPRRPLMRDVFSECAKCYWSLLHPIVREENLAISANEPRALRFRNSAKSALDLFRMHYAFVSAQAGNEREMEALWHASREELTTLLPASIYGGELPKLVSLLTLRAPMPAGDELFTLFTGLIYRALLCMDEIALALEKGAMQEEGGMRSFAPLSSGTKVLQSGNKIGVDHYSLSVREVFAERMILRNKDCIRRTLVSDATAHMVFPFFRNPSLETFRQVLTDLRVASTSFNKSSVALPLTEATLRELERSSFLDSPFHAFHEHQESKLGDDGHVHSSTYSARSHELPQNILQKTYSEVSLSIRFQPPPDFVYLVENLVSLVLQLRVAEECGEIATDFYSAIARYSERHPLRAHYLKEQMGKYLNLCNEDEDRYWAEVSRLTDELGVKYPHRASLVRSQVNAIKNRKYDADWKLQLATTDLWVELTPFLRLEMNSLRDRYYPVKSQLKL
jgi:hypothetical protein